MVKSKKILAFFIIPLLYVWHCTAKNFSTEEAQKARENIVSTAKQYIGCPYKSGAVGPDYFDCSGLIYTVFHDAAAVQMPRSVKVMYSRAKTIKLEEAEPGDLIFFKTTGDGSISHVGIYIGKNQFIHAASDGNNTGVIVSSLKEKYYANSYASTGRVIPAGNFNQDSGESKGDEADDEILTEEDISESGKGGGASSGGAGSNTASGSASKKNIWYKNLVFDAALFCDWNFFLPERVMLNWRGIAVETNVRYAAWKFQPGIGTIFRYNNGTKNFQIPIVASLNVNDYIKFYAGPVINCGTPYLPDSNKTRKIKGSVFPGIIGLSFQTPKIKAGKVLLSLVQDFDYTVYNDTDGGALNFGNSLTSGLVFSTGVRVTLPMSNLFN